MKTLSKPVISAIMSNLAKAAEKQQLPDEARRLAEIGEASWEPLSGNMTLADLKQNVESDIETGYSSVSIAAGPEAADDGGAQRCVKWGEKVTTIQKSLVGRYESKGEDLFDGKVLYLCEACGFIALASETPQICPVCKAPSSRFSQVK